MTIEQQLADVVRKQVSEELRELVIPLLEKIAQATAEREGKTDSEIRVRQCDLPDYIGVSVTKIKTLRKMPNAPHCKGEIDALKKLIATVNAEKQVEIGAHTVQTAFDNAKCKKDFCDWVSAMKKNTSFVFTSEASTLINKLRKPGKRFQVRMSVQDAAQWELKERAGLDPA